MLICLNLNHLAHSDLQITFQGFVICSRTACELGLPFGVHHDVHHVLGDLLWILKEVT